MILTVTFVILTQFLLGFGVATRLRAVTNGYSLLGISMLIGLGLSSILPILLQLVHLPLAPQPLFAGLGLLAGLSLLFLRGQSRYLRETFSSKRLWIRLYELPFLGFWGYLLVLSAWKCAWFPNIPFDTLVGPDLVATFAVKEHTLVSSVFTQHLPAASTFSNQPFYAPFTAMQQIIYLLAGLPFGKMWLTILVVSFGLFLYADLRERIHPILAGLLITLIACSPELFSYTFLVQTDWANAAFFATGVLLLERYLTTGQRGQLVGSAGLMALACWTRTETIFFVPLGALLVFVQGFRLDMPKAFGRAILYVGAGLVPVLFWNYGFLRGYMSLPPTATLGTVHGLTNGYMGKLLAVFGSMNEQVVLKQAYWNYAVPFFLALTLLNVALFRDKRGIAVLIWIMGVYLLFGFIIQHVDGANIPYTFRRGFFKLLLLIPIYLSYSSLCSWLSDRLYSWEGRPLPVAFVNPQPTS